MEYKCFNNSQDITHYFGNLLTDVDYNYSLGSKLFYTESEQFNSLTNELHSFESKTVINILVNNAFKHQITLNDKTLSLIALVSHIFNLSTISQYKNNEFKRLYIDSKVST